MFAEAYLFTHVCNHQHLFGHLHPDRIVVRPAVAAKPEDVAVALAIGADDGCVGLAVDAEEAVRA